VWKASGRTEAMMAMTDAIIRGVPWRYDQGRAGKTAVSSARNRLSHVTGHHFGQSGADRRNLTSERFSSIFLSFALFQKPHQPPPHAAGQGGEFVPFREFQRSNPRENPCRGAEREAPGLANSARGLTTRKRCVR
jgi:hypothetical protein